MHIPVAPPATRHAHSTTALFVHVVWSTHRRAPWLDLSFDQRLAELLGQLSRRVGAEALAVGNAADHVHAVVRHPPSVALSDVMQRLKGASARAMHAAVPHAAGHLWQVGYWAESVSPIAVPTVVAYVRDQRSHHDLHREPTEPWEAWAP
jgi:putative transposase